MGVTSRIIAGLVLGAACITAAPVEPTAASLNDRASGVIIGYRTVSSAQAQSYNSAGTVTFTGNVGGTQTGSGVYTSPNLGEWPVVPANPWYCVIFADPTKFNAANKAWIPQTGDSQTLWFASDAVINVYISQLDSDWDPMNTLRLSQVQGDESFQQMSIPSGLLGTNGLLGITTYCKSDKSQLPSSTVDYSSFQNVKGPAP